MPTYLSRTQPLACDLNQLLRALGECHNNTLEYYEKGKKITRPLSDLYPEVLKVCAFIRQHNLVKGDKAGILGSDCLDWIIIDIACVVSGLVTVPFDGKKKYGAGALEELTRDYGLRVLFTNDKEVLKENVGFTVPFSILREAGAADGEMEQVPFDREEVFTIIHTSGTSGNPKSIGVNRGSFEELAECTERLFSFDHQDKFLMFIPLSVYWERVHIYSAILLGYNLLLVPIEFLFQAIKKDKPTVITGIPFFYESVQRNFLAKVRANRLHHFVYRLYRLLVALKLGFLVKNRFTPFTNLWGGKVKYLLVGSAPSSMNTLAFYESMGLPIYEGYGMSEVGGSMIALNYPGSRRAGSVGRVFPAKEVAFDETGQILVKGKYCPRQYYKSTEEENRTTYLDNGYVATGDVGYLDKDNFLYIKGRTKETIVLSNGKKILPSRVESTLKSSALISQCLVFGDNKPFLTALIIPDSKDTKYKSILKEIEAINNALQPDEKIVKFFLSHDPFSVQNKMMTDTLKINRKVIIQKYEKDFLSLY